MNRSELSKVVAKDVGITAQAADGLVRSVFAAIMSGTIRDGACTITNFGTFEVRRRKGRKISSPFSDGQDAEITEGFRVGFRTGKGFKELVDRPPDRIAESA